MINKNNVKKSCLSLSRGKFLKTSLLMAGGLIFTSEKNIVDDHANEKEDFNKDYLLEKYLDCLGGALPEHISREVVIRETIRKDGYRIESLIYKVEEGEKIPALLLIPDEATSSNPVPGIAGWHQHNGEFHLGKSEPAGLAGNPMRHTAVALVREGYVVLCPDALCFEERQDSTGKLKGGSYERFEFLRQIVRGRSLAWKNILDMRGAIDCLSSRKEVIVEIKQQNVHFFYN